MASLAPEQTTEAPQQTTEAPQQTDGPLGGDADETSTSTVTAEPAVKTGAGADEDTRLPPWATNERRDAVKAADEAGREDQV